MSEAAAPVAAAAPCRGGTLRSAADAALYTGTLEISDNAELVQIQNNPLLAAYYGPLLQLQRVGQLVLSHNLGLCKHDVPNMLERVERGAAQPMIATQAASREPSLR